MGVFRVGAFLDGAFLELGMELERAALEQTLHYNLFSVVILNKGRSYQ